MGQDPVPDYLNTSRDTQVQAPVYLLTSPNTLETIKCPKGKVPRGWLLWQDVWGDGGGWTKVGRELGSSTVVQRYYSSIIESPPTFRQDYFSTVSV